MYFIKMRNTKENMLLLLQFYSYHKKILSKLEYALDCIFKKKILFIYFRVKH